MRLLLEASSEREVRAEKRLLRGEAVYLSSAVNPVTGRERNAEDGDQFDLMVSRAPALRPKGRTTNVDEPEMLSSFGVIFPGR